MDKKERQKIEDEHNLRMKQFFRTEEELDRNMREFEHHSNYLMEMVAEAFRAVPDATAGHYLYALEDNLDQYRRDYNENMDDLLELRYRENQSYFQKLEEE